ncbi:ectonucleotide pyrophosphatase/phosphodiesterase family member 5-like [Montipora foliosa]|uniref:ectonucleotide pyrophosphatase/phosphodiesterase family member 5-like n=1 Tax=Montipora foliosa TaxID=591990 RepID=UPI0035F215EC
MFAFFFAGLWCLPLLLACIVSRISAAQSPLIIVSMDALDWRILRSQVANTPNFDFIAQTGVKAEYIKNVEPILTWPNHHSILTGLYSESHGIVSNIFWDPVYEEMFVFGYDCSCFDPKFYNDSEPIWLTLQKNGGRSASYFWPGTTSYAEKPTYHKKETCLLDCRAIHAKDLPKYRNRTLPGFPPYVHCAFNFSIPWSDRINQAIEWLLLDEPPQFLALYFYVLDSIGHLYGPYSQQYRETLEKLDRDAVGLLLKRLEETGLLEKVNLIFVSDHGMNSVSSTRVIYLEDFIDSSAYFLTQDGPIVHLWPHHGMESEIVNNLTRKPIPHVRKVFRKEDIPVEYHWKNNRRIPPIIIDPAVGWVVIPSRNDTFSDKGSHGWPSSVSKSYSIFYARGPAFRKGMIVNPFNTVDLYPLMCKLLGIEPRPNNGSLENVEAVLKKTNMETLKGVQIFVCPSIGLTIILVALGLCVAELM